MGHVTYVNLMMSRVTCTILSCEFLLALETDKGILSRVCDALFY